MCSSALAHRAEYNGYGGGDGHRQGSQQRDVVNTSVLFQYCAPKVAVAVDHQSALLATRGSLQLPPVPWCVLRRALF